MALPVFYFPIFNAGYLKNLVPDEVCFLSNYIGPQTLATPSAVKEHFSKALPLTYQERKYFLDSVQEYFYQHPQLTSIKENIRSCQMTSYIPALSPEEILALRQIAEKKTRTGTSRTVENDPASLSGEILGSFHRLLLLALYHEALFFDASQLMEAIAKKETLLWKTLHSTPANATSKEDALKPEESESLLSPNSGKLEQQNYHPENWQQLLLALAPFLPKNSYLITVDEKVASFLHENGLPEKFHYQLPPTFVNNYKNFCAVQAPLKEFLPKSLARTMATSILNISCTMLIPYSQPKYSMRKQC